jgi:hypothetical protein
MLARCHGFTSVVVDNLDLVRVSVPPAEAYPPLVIEADRVLALPIAVELLKPVPRWYAEILQLLGRINEYELSQHDALKLRRKVPDALTVEEPFRIPAGEAGDHPRT